MTGFIPFETLKRDDMGTIERGEFAGREVICRRAAAGLMGPVARWLLGREARALEGLMGPDGGVPGIAEFVLRPARGVLLRSWIDGVPLHRAERLPADFFELLVDLVAELHARGLVHNDLHKEPNILVQPSGQPALVDFQLASLHRVGSRSWKRRVAEDLRHVAKHAARYRAQDGGARSRASERGLVARVWMATGKRLYNWITRRWLKRTDSEGRRPRSGPWPTWDAALGAPKKRP